MGKAKWGIPGVLLLAACETAMPTAPSAPIDFAAAITIPNAAEKVIVCKDGPAEFTYSFSIGLAPGFPGASSGNLLVSNPFTVTGGECVTVADQGNGTIATVQELIPTDAPYEFVRVDVYAQGIHDPAPTLVGSSTVNDPVSRNYGDFGAVFVYTNVAKEIPGGGQGCTPGYWKQKHHFGNWPAPYGPDMQFSAVFEDAFPGMSLLDVLKQGGGGLKALGRHTVAALLNAASGDVSYAFTTSDVIDGFNAVFPGDSFESLKGDFERENERGCPLGRADD